MSRNDSSALLNYLEEQQVSEILRRHFPTHSSEPEQRVFPSSLFSPLSNLREYSVAGFYGSGRGCIWEVGPTLALSFTLAGSIVHRLALAFHSRQSVWDVSLAEVFPAIAILIGAMLLLFRYIKWPAEGTVVSAGCILSLVSTLGICIYYSTITAVMLRSLGTALIVALGTAIFGIVFLYPSVLILKLFVALICVCLAVAKRQISPAPRYKAWQRASRIVSIIDNVGKQTRAGLTLFFEKVFRLRFILLASVSAITVGFFNKNIWEFLFLMRPPRVWFFALIVVALLAALVFAFADHNAKIVWPEGRELVIRSFSEGRVPSKLSFLPSTWLSVQKNTGLSTEALKLLFNDFEATLGPSMFALFRSQFIVRTILVIVINFGMLFAIIAIVTLVTTGSGLYITVTKTNPGQLTSIGILGMDFYAEVLLLQLQTSLLMTLGCTATTIPQLFNNSSLQLGHVQPFKDKCVNWYCSVFIYIVTLGRAVPLSIDSTGEDHLLRVGDHGPVIDPAKVENWREGVLGIGNHAEDEKKSLV